MKTIKAQFFRVCPKTGRILGLQQLKQQRIWLFPFIGLAALIWFLIRVVPKPSRASYPCQRVAMPLALSFISWVVGSSASAIILHKVQNPIQKRLLRVAFCLVIGALALGGEVPGAAKHYLTSYTAHTPNAPIGVAQGLKPGRVVWVHDPDVTDWAGLNSGQRWYDHVDQSVTNDMMSWALRGYADQDTDAAAWNKIFGYYNGGTGYTQGEKILIKINLVTSWDDGSYTQTEGDGRFLDSIAHTPQVLKTLLDQLINTVGVAQANITIGDPTGLFVNYLYTPLHTAFPNVHYTDYRGTMGRTKAQYTNPCVPFYWSTSDANGKTQDCVVQSYYEAKYIINFAVLKSHYQAGITGIAKNHYGSMLRTPDSTGYYNLHDRLPLLPTNLAWHNMGYYRPMVDQMGSDYISGKTVLYLIDGTFGGKDWNSLPSTWSMTPFNGDWPSSLFVSMDPVAIDSVAFDFLSQKWPEHALAYEGVQDYLHEAALADNPPSGTCYDPERDAVCMSSLGVHEHWNNVVNKQYSRNLGTGNGIELLYVVSDPSLTEYTLVTSNNGHGSVTLNPTGGIYPSGTTVTLTPEPSEGYQFSSWSGTNAGDIINTAGVYTIVMSGNKSITANFLLNPITCYQLTLSSIGQGTNPTALPENSTGCPTGRYIAGEAISLSGAVPNNGWHISGWTGTANDSSTASTNFLTMPASVRSVSVVYTQDRFTCYLPLIQRLEFKSLQPATNQYHHFRCSIQHCQKF